MLRLPHTVSIAFVHGMLSGTCGQDQPAGPWLDAAGIDRRLAERPSARVTVEQYVALFASLMEGLDDELLGFLSRPLRRGTLALLMRSTPGAATVGHALRRLCRSFGLMQDDVDLVEVRDGTLAGFRLVFPNERCARRPFLHELLARVFWRATAWLHGGHLDASRFEFAFAPPEHAPEYRRVFPGDVRFDATHTTVWFEAAALDAPLLRSEADIRGFLARAPGIVIVPGRGGHATSARVRGFLQRSRPAWPDLATTAAALQLSASTLQRRLAAESVGFRALKDQLRLDLAIVRLNTTTMPLAALAIELGFADGPAFQRAFKSWTGSAPGTYRRAEARSHPSAIRTRVAEFRDDGR